MDTLRAGQATETSRPRVFWPATVAGILLLVPAGIVVLETRGGPLAPETAPEQVHRSVVVEAGEGSIPKSATPVTAASEERSAADAESDRGVDIVERIHAETGSNLDEADRPAGRLERIVADWRYVGHITSGDTGIGLVERLEFPGRRSPLREGDRLEGVIVREVSPEMLNLELGGDRVSLVIDRRPAFEPERVELPEDLLGRPEELALAVFAQTLGRYRAETPEWASSEADNEPAGREAMESLARKNDWDAPGAGETLDEWAEGLAESLSRRIEEGSLSSEAFYSSEGNGQNDIHE